MNVNILMAAFLTSIVRGHHSDKVDQSFHLVVVKTRQRETKIGQHRSILDNLGRKKGSLIWATIYLLTSQAACCFAS